MKKIIGIMALLALVSVNAAAQPLLSYDYVQAAYQHTFFDESAADDGNGLELLGSYSPIDNLFLELGYTYTDTGVDSIDIDSDEFRYNLGGYYPINDTLHLVGRFGGLHDEVDVDGAGEIDDDQWFANAELRALFCDVEGNASATYVDDDGWSYGIGTVVPVADPVAFAGRVEINEDTDVRLTAGLRLIW